MQRKNWLVFFLASGTFIFGLYALQRWVFPPPPPVPPKEQAEKLTPRQRRARALGTAAGGLAAHVAPGPPRPAAKLAFGERLGAAAGTGWLAVRGRAAPEKPPPAPRVATPAPPPIPLGSDDPGSPFHLQAVLSPRGAAVRRIVLNKFEAANRLGRPAGEILTLVPEDDHLASYVLYHFDIDRPRSKAPLDELGRADWKVERVERSDERHAVSFSATVQGVKVTKTFSLAPGEYHLGLEVKLERAGAPRGEKFRYQLAGAHGLPIEGAWYTTTFRHCLIGLAEGDKFHRRNNQDIREVRTKLGGDAVTPDSGQRIQYAAVAVQFFACAIVVDDEQPEKGFLSSARPTLEARAVSIESERDQKVLPGQDRITVRDKKNPNKPSETYYLTAEVAKELSQREFRPGEKFGLLVVSLPLAPETADVDKPEEVAERLRAVAVLPYGEPPPPWFDDLTVRVNTEPLELPDKGEVVHKYLLYNGPVKPMLLGQLGGAAEVSDDLVQRYVNTLHLYTLTDYPSSAFTGSCFFSWWVGLIIFFTNKMHQVLWVIHNVVPNYGICIIILTVLVRGLLFPISKKQAQTSLRMQEMAPEMKKLREKYKDDPREMQSKMMELYRKHKINPLGSCWLLLLQLPIFMGLYYALQESIHFRLAGFLWMDNLAAPDMLVWWGENIPWLSKPEDFGGLLYLGPFFNLLPILAVTLMVFQQKLMMPPPTDEQQAMQQKMMKYMMIFFGLFFYKVAAGLCIYFIASTLWGFAERKLLPKKKPDDRPDSADEVPQRTIEPALPRPEAEPRREAIAPAGGPQGNRARRRQERKRRQERSAQVPAAPSPGPREETPRRPPEEANGGLRGWWAGVRRKVRNWWEDVLKKASKK